MSNDISLDTFPSNRLEALTILYLQNQDVSRLSPSQLVDKYLETYAEIKQQFNVRRNDR